MNSFRNGFRSAGILPSAIAAFLCGGAGALLGACGPFTDVAADAFCPLVLEIFTLGITTGTTATTYDPTGNVTRVQMAAFLSRSVDGVLKRGSRRAALGQFWINGGGVNLNVTTLLTPVYVVSDGADVFVSDSEASRVYRIRGSDGRFLETWTGASSAVGVLAAVGRVYVTGYENPGKLYRIDPSVAGSSITTLATNLGAFPNSIAFDGTRFWTANTSTPGSLSIATPGATVPWTVTTITTGFQSLWGAVFDGAHVWVTDYNAGSLLKLDSNGAILQTVTVVSTPQVPVFDGANIWVPNNFGSAVSVVRASNGAVLATLTGNGLNNPATAAFDGERVLITNYSGNGVSLFKAADLSPLGFFATGVGSTPYGACSDGINFWIVLRGYGNLARF